MKKMKNFRIDKRKKKNEELDKVSPTLLYYFKCIAW